MFEAVELGRTLSKGDYRSRARELRSALLEAQARVREAGVPVFVIVGGVEGAGKGDVVSLLHDWMDVRGLETTAFWDETDDERMRPRWWRFWRAMPPRGKIGVFFGSWYTTPIAERGLDQCTVEHFDFELERIRRFERMLVDDGALIVKLWYHLSRKAQKARLKAEAKGKRERLPPQTRTFAEHYDAFLSTAERALRKTDTGPSRWHIIEADDWRFRDVTTGEILLEALQRHLDTLATVEAPAADTRESAIRTGQDVSVLDRVPLDRKLGENAYDKRYDELQEDIYGLAWEAHNAGINSVLVFEGWDAAGKGGVIRRLTRAMDARLYQVHQVAAPSDEERAHHYLWRFWRQLPRQGYHTIYDRSWYGRVLVERVEGLAVPEDWERSYSEINLFEEQLVEHGMILCKFWLHIDPDEQLRRFEAREQIPWKRYKITDEDWRNRDRWQAYEQAVNEMVARTSTESAPWTLVPANDKRYARIQVLQCFRDALAQRLEALR